MDVCPVVLYIGTRHSRTYKYILPLKMQIHSHIDVWSQIASLYLKMCELWNLFVLGHFSLLVSFRSHEFVYMYLFVFVLFSGLDFAWKLKRLISTNWLNIDNPRYWIG